MHVLDDGFQHFDLMRDVDLLVAPDDARRHADAAVRPISRAARCRAAADALLVDAEDGLSLRDPAYALA